MRRISHLDDILESTDIDHRMNDLTINSWDDETDAWLNNDDRKEYMMWNQLKLDIGSAWNFQLTFIAEDYFEEYTQYFLEDLYHKATNSWPFDLIDWAATARKLESNFCATKINGYTFWYQY